MGSHKYRSSPGRVASSCRSPADPDDQQNCSESHAPGPLRRGRQASASVLPPPHTPQLWGSLSHSALRAGTGGTRGCPYSLLPGVRSPSGFPLLVPASSAQVSGARRLCEGSRAPGAPGWLCPPHTPQSPSRAGVTSLKDRRPLGCARIPVSEVSRACREVFPGKGKVDGGWVRWVPCWASGCCGQHLPLLKTNSQIIREPK